MAGQEELLLAEEQSVLNRKAGAKEAIKEVLHIGRDAEGTLLLTDSRLIFLIGDREEDLPEFKGRRGKKLVYADVEGGIPQKKLDIVIPLNAVTDAKGVRGGVENPRLILSWNEGGQVHQTEFVQQITGTRSKNLNDWATVILKLKSGELKPVQTPTEPGQDTLKGKVLSVLGDMQEKGLFTIEEEVEERYGLDLSPDDVEASCESLVSDGLVEKGSFKDGGVFYRMRSPLGDYDLSS